MPENYGRGTEVGQSAAYVPKDRENCLAAANQIMAAGRAAASYRRGRGAALNPKGRFEKLAIEAAAADQTEEEEENWPPARLQTQVQVEKPRSIINRNDLPDIPYDYSINPYRGCEHGCIYCYARPSHAYMGLSAGLDFESRLFAKPEAAALLRRELAHPAYQPRIIMLGSNTDPYQPVEKHYQITRSLLEVLYEARHPVHIITKSALILRDSDILAALAEAQLVHVAFSITSLDNRLARRLEPRAAAPARRLQAMQRLAEQNVPVSLMLAPIIPALNDHEIENIMRAAAAAGAETAHYTLLRLPYEVAPLFKDWLLREYPDKYRRVIGQLRLLRGGKENNAGAPGHGCGQGVMAVLLARRFQLAAEKYGLNRQKIRLTSHLFHVPAAWRPAADRPGNAGGAKRPGSVAARAPAAQQKKEQLLLL
ncbi:PA0069 family radical SAM protein [Candidatus Tokpelaia sp.]|uniref:PA0069 family radical SAM protein n=1 Tax=Candidatus Tokpelaia sp. TaxID=2233777 RepID=UPI00123AA666|nr:PA0069 family radical SAM protein [Candidatus Tokpelaia sp.]KAA6405333.1 radical SAM protein [Candidatus Tokpelaia sp.]